MVVIVVEVSSHFTHPEFTPGLESSKTLFSLNPWVTRDSRVTPGLPLDSKTGHKWVKNWSQPLATDLLPGHSSTTTHNPHGHNWSAIPGHPKNRSTPSDTVRTKWLLTQLPYPCPAISFSISPSTHSL